MVAAFGASGQRDLSGFVELEVADDVRGHPGLGQRSSSSSLFRCCNRETSSSILRSWSPAASDQSSGPQGPRLSSASCRQEIGKIMLSKVW